MHLDLIPPEQRERSLLHLPDVLCINSIFVSGTSGPVRSTVSLYYHPLTTPLTLHLVFGGHPNVRNGGIATNVELRDNMSAHPGYSQSGSVVFTHDTSPHSVASPLATNTSDNSSWPSPSDLGYLTLGNSPDVGSQFGQDAEAYAAHQVSWDMLADRHTVIPRRKGRRYHAQRDQDGASEQLSYTTLEPASSRGPRKSEKRFPCTVCPQSFKHASDWKRHEASVHGYNDQEWTCMLTEAFKLQSECIFCLEPMVSIDHLHKHAVVPCSIKRTIERTFPRKDLLKQHVLLAHLADESTLVRKDFKVPQEWSRALDLSPGGPGSRWCGFCGCMLETTAKRMDHVAQHFRKGQNMTSWIRM